MFYIVLFSSLTYFYYFQLKISKDDIRFFIHFYNNLNDYITENYFLSRIIFSLLEITRLISFYLYPYLECCEVQVLDLHSSCIRNVNVERLKAISIPFYAYSNYTEA